MTDASYVIGGWVATGGILLAYTLHLFRRTRKVAEQLPPEERTWR